MTEPPGSAINLHLTGLFSYVKDPLLLLNITKTLTLLFLNLVFGELYILCRPWNGLLDSWTGVQDGLQVASYWIL